MDINKQELDRHITGNYGEDQFKGIKEADLELLAEEMYVAFCEKHKEVFSKAYEEAKFKPPEATPQFPPTWKMLSTELKECWIAAAKCAMDEYIS